MSRVRKFLSNFVIPDPSTDVYTSNDIEISQANFSFRIPIFDKKEVTLSPKACVRNLPWTFTIQLNEPGDDTEDDTDSSLSVFVMCSYDTNNDWSCTADFSFTLLSSMSSKNLVRSFSHRFDRTQCIDGFDSFITWNALVDPENGYIDGGHKISFEVMMICNEPERVPWNSRRHTRYVGTMRSNSFLSSLIQILYTIESFRTNVNSLSSDIEIQNVVGAIRHIFQQLQLSDVPVSIDPFIKSLKNRVYDATAMEDTENFFELFYKQLLKRQSTKQIWDLFHGQMSTRSTSTSEYEITKFRKLNGLKLEIFEDSDVEQLIQSFFTTDDGESDFDASIPVTTTPYESRNSRWFHGLIMCTNPVIRCYRPQITQLPSIFILHFYRRRVALTASAAATSHLGTERNRKLKFGATIDFDKFVRRHVDSSTKYTLHAVLIRCDTFVAFVNQHNGNKDWLKFDGDIVSHCTEKEAIDDNFRCVQMLVYVKCNEPRICNGDDKATIFNCVICMEMSKSLAIFSTVCGHVFCGPCIKKEIVLRQKCPICQNGLTKSDIHPIYI